MLIFSIFSIFFLSYLVEVNIKRENHSFMMQSRISHQNWQSLRDSTLKSKPGKCTKNQFLLLKIKHFKQITTYPSFFLDSAIFYAWVLFEFSNITFG